MTTTWLAAVAVLALVTTVAFGQPAPLPDDLPAGRWPVEKANAWWKAQGKLVGCNYLPATAQSFHEMWASETFDPATIKAELDLARGIGLNCLRVNLQYLLWEEDAAGYKRRIDAFLTIAHERGYRTMIVLHDDCHFGSIGPEPVRGKQPAIVPGEYASGFSGSPGQSRVLDPAAWPKLEEYVKDIVSTYKDDARVFCWDLYNEPGNSGMENGTLPLLRLTTRWAREIAPSQPLTVGVFGKNDRINKMSVDASDVVSFHNYDDKASFERQIVDLKQHNRPIICTEWLNRPRANTVADILPLFAKHDVGAMHWGLVNGRTQTHLPWGAKAGTPEPERWQHDLYRNDRTPYDAAELEMFKAFK